jgi:deferrochelatase/peroxidase EfeB
MLYGCERDLNHQDLVAGHQSLLGHFGGYVVHATPCSPVEDRLDLEHFGFRDGISQPVIRGTRKESRPVPERDVVPAGEFLLGYRNVIGRWRDGSPLVGHSDTPASLASDKRPPNDFAYGVKDPRGLACPLGAHIRRANPRDSQEPGDRDEQSITNRHRLLRRGRTYSYEADGPDSGIRAGLLFIALCADLERQFEFVQRSWLNATSFHGLVNERDPLLGGPAGADRAKKPGDAQGGTFTIPTAVGPVRVPSLQSHVTLRGGGYFFLPSRSALAFLINRCSRLTSLEEERA